MFKRVILGLTAAVALTTPLVAQGFSGAYLAAQSANRHNDYAEAARYYSEAMIEDPGNGFIMQGAMVVSVAAGDFDAAALVAQQMTDAGFVDTYAQTVLIVDAFVKADFGNLDQLLADERFEVNPLVTTLIVGWVLAAEGDLDAASQHFSSSSENGALNSFANYHNALALSLAGNFAEAEAILAVEGAYVNRGSILAHAEILAELGRRDDALNLLTVGVGNGIIDREADNLRVALSNDGQVGFTRISAPADAVSDAFLVLADAISNDNSPRLALFFARLAEKLQADNTEALLLIAQILSEQNQHELAIDAYQSVSVDDPFATNVAIGLAGALQRNDQEEQAIVVLQNLAADQPDDLTVWQSLADAKRQNSQLDDAFAAYSKAIDLLPDPDLPAAWRLYYVRGIVSERLKDWTNAEWNFRQALALNPAQPDVLNYLGYSLVERGENLDEALAMIEKAVEARPQSGAITDSLGWVYYRLGRFEDAVPVMENAVSLLPVDPIINDHLGDVLWKVGRFREAKFQWRRALSFEPEDVDAERIRKKIAQGLDEVLEAETGAAAE